MDASTYDQVGCDGSIIDSKYTWKHNYEVTKGVFLQEMSHECGSRALQIR